MQLLIGRGDKVPYKTIDKLPNGIKDNLPKHAQEIYKSAFNSALEQYEAEDDPEQTAHRVAWAAVKAKYEKTNGSWTKK
jgi:cation transport regulator